MLYDLNATRNNFTSMSSVIKNMHCHQWLLRFRYFITMHGQRTRTTKFQKCLMLFGIMVIYRSKVNPQIQFKSILGSKFNQSMKVSSTHWVHNENFSNHNWLISVFSKYFKRIYGCYTQYVNELAGCSLIMGHPR